MANSFHNRFEANVLSPQLLANGHGVEVAGCGEVECPPTRVDMSQVTARLVIPRQTLFGYDGSPQCLLTKQVYETSLAALPVDDIQLRQISIYHPWAVARLKTSHTPLYPKSVIWSKQLRKQPNMRHFILFVLAALPPFLPTSVGTPPGPVQGAGYVSWPTREINGASLRGLLSKRQTKVQADSVGGGVAYVVDIAVGTPSQVVSVVVDTGSGALWVNPTCGNFCPAGHFDPSKSNSIEYTGSNDTISYLRGSVDLELVFETVKIGGGCTPRFSNAHFPT